MSVRHDHLGLLYLYLAVWRLILLCSFPMALLTSTAPTATGSAQHHTSTSGTSCWDTTCAGGDTALLGIQRCFCLLHLWDEVLITCYLHLNFI